MSTRILTDIEKYYDGKILEHGDTPLGVDWNGADSQEARFLQLIRVIELEHFSIADLGCGYGALFPYLEKLNKHFSYYGYDVSKQMLSHAKTKFGAAGNATFFRGSELSHVADYAVASGIFNVKQQSSDANWYEYIIQTIDNLDKHSKFGFAFNCLTKYSDKPKMKPHLYYADPLHLFEHCKINYSRNVALLHDYNLYEFTIIVRK